MNIFAFFYFLSIVYSFRLRMNVKERKSFTTKFNHTNISRDANEIAKWKF